MSDPKSPWSAGGPAQGPFPPVPGPWSVPGGQGPWGMPPAPPTAQPPDPDPELGLAAERQAAFAAQATGFDFRGAIAASGRRSLFLILGLTAAAVLVGALLSGGVLFGLLDRARNGISGEEASWAIMGALGFGALSLLAAWIRLRGADARILEQQGAIEVLPDDPAVRGDPLLRRLWNVTEEASLAAGLPMPRVFVLEETALNAFAVGVEPKTAGVAATRGLLEALSREELAAVMAHEVAHIAQGDTRIMVTAAATAGVAMLAIDLLLRIRVGGRNAWIHVVAVLAALLVAAVVMPTLKAALSRQREYRADALAARLRRDGSGLASALQRISENPRVARADHAVAELYILSPFGSSLVDRLLSTHPPTERRIARLLDLRAD